MKLRFVLIKDNKGLSRMNVFVDCPLGGCIHELFDCSYVLKEIIKCVKDEETEKRN